MGTLFAGLRSSAGALDALNQAIDVTQNNVDNASTPGYASQTPVNQALPFNAEGGLIGGVKAGPVQSSRDQFAEKAVWQQQENLGLSNGMLDGLNALQQLFDVTGQSGLPAALNQLFSSFSNWSTTPGDATARGQVLSSAQAVAQSFNATAKGVQQAAAGADQQIQSTVAQINQLATAIAKINAQRQAGGPDAGLDAQLNSDLEQLSQLANINVLYKDDGTVTVLAGSETPLVLGDQASQLTAAVTGNGVQILDSNHTDISANVSGGSLAGLLQFTNQIVPGLIGNSQTPGTLNTLAQTLADTVNQILTSGATDTSATATAGVPLFTYTAGSPNTVAQSFAVSSTITPAALAAASLGPPPVANGAASALANLGTAANASLGNMSITDYYSQIASGVGSEQASASSNQQLGQQLVAQAQNARANISGVSLNAEAAALMQYQQSFQAIAKIITVIGDMTDSIINTIQY